MRLLQAQEIAVQKAQERNRLIDRYQEIVARIEPLKKEIRKIETDLDQLQREITTQLNNL